MNDTARTYEVTFTHRKYPDLTRRYTVVEYSELEAEISGIRKFEQDGLSRIDFEYPTVRVSHK